MEYFTVIESVVNLRREPKEGTSLHVRDDLQETQLLFHERVRVMDEHKDWFFVEAVEQEIFRRNQRWQGYPGWVRKESVRPAKRTGTPAIVKTGRAPVFGDPSDAGSPLFCLSLGTKIDVGAHFDADSLFFSIDVGDGGQGWVEKRRLRFPGNVLQEEGSEGDLTGTALLFLGTPYLWGGRSMHMPGLYRVATGVDCSGLTNLVFRAHGIDIPRDAHDQWLKAEPVSGTSLKPGELVFVSLDAGIVNHVMIFMGGEEMMEAPDTGDTVRILTFKEKFDKNLEELARGATLGGGREVMFGRVAPSL